MAKKDIDKLLYIYNYIIMTNKDLTEQEFYVTIGRRLRDLRKIAGLTQQEVAEKAGIKQPALATFEKNGKRITSAHIIERIVKATGHTMGDLFSPAEKKTTFTGSSTSLCPS